MNVMMEFPKTVEEFMESYKVVDTEEIYTNGMELVPIFRMRQWFGHIGWEEEQYKKFAEWVADRIFSDDFEDDSFAEVACRKLEKLGLVKKVVGNWRYVEPNCGARMEK